MVTLTTLVQNELQAGPKQKSRLDEELNAQVAVGYRLEDLFPQTAILLRDLRATPLLRQPEAVNRHQVTRYESIPFSLREMLKQYARIRSPDDPTTYLLVKAQIEEHEFMRIEEVARTVFAQPQWNEPPFVKPLVIASHNNLQTGVQCSAVTLCAPSRTLVFDIKELKRNSSQNGPWYAIASYTIMLAGLHGSVSTHHAHS